MFFWSFMLVTVLLVPATMLYFGKRFLAHPPEKINNLFGYRTPMSMKNQDTWDFAHRCCGKLWKTWGLVLLAASLLAMLPFLGKNIETVALAGTVLICVQGAALVASLFSTERALKKHFDRDGYRR